MTIANKKTGYDEVVARDLEFNLDASEVSKHWFNNEPWTTHWMNAVLAAVPDAERWVMTSARKQLDRINDPIIKSAALEFIRQERIHAREHDIMNAALVDNGLPVDRLDRIFKRGRKWLQDRLSVELQGAVAASFEHFTAVISEIMLKHPEAFEETNPKIVEMLYWHFVEETEHKSVSFDVFIEACGDDRSAYLTRLGGMAIGTAIGLGIILGYHSYLLWKDGQLLNARSAGRMGKFLLYKPGILTGVVRQYLPYFHPRFHPWDHDNRDVIKPWKDEYERSGDATKAYEALINWLEENSRHPKSRKSTLVAA